MSKAKTTTKPTTVEPGGSVALPETLHQMVMELRQPRPKNRRIVKTVGGVRYTAIRERNDNIIAQAEPEALGRIRDAHVGRKASQQHAQNLARVAECEKQLQRWEGDITTRVHAIIADTVKTEEVVLNFLEHKEGADEEVPRKVRTECESDRINFDRWKAALDSARNDLAESEKVDKAGARQPRYSHFYHLPATGAITITTEE